ncbi:uncharacterized protein TNCV_1696551 [Trichonephila clavipes]|nr:uncharacterized protein TNCV_1696551 [Trichonephila clavipes]
MERSDHLLSSPGLYCRLAVTRGRFCCLRQSFAVIMTKVATVFNFDNIVQQYASRVLSVFKHLHTLNSRQAISPLGWLVEEEERCEAPGHPQGFLPLNWGETEQNRTVTCMVLKAKANDRCKNSSS